MIQGVLMKRYSGFYYVYAEDRVWECTLRGRFRIKGQDFLTGDRVEILPGKDGRAAIEGVIERRNSLVRPPIANVDQVMLIFALTSPTPDLNLLDRLLVQISYSDIKPLIVLTKLDLLKSSEEEQIWSSYEKAGYTVLKVSNKKNQGIAEVQKHLAGKISVLAGPSGVGKSSLLNSLAPGLELKTGEVSRKLERGKHTTRHVELMVCAGGLVADTPGFSTLYLPKMKREDLAWYFPEFTNYIGSCRFKSCLHNQEPDCAIKTAVKNGEISPVRYEHYLEFLQEVILDERRY